MKNILKHIGVAALALAAVLMTATTASAQGTPSYVPTTIALTPTNIPTLGVSNILTTIDVSRQKDVYMMFSFKVSEASSISNMTYTFYKSADGVVFDTNNAINIKIPAQGSTVRVDYGTNITVNGVGYLELFNITNASLGTMTNYGVTYGIKQLAP
jgi:hypothetical protein